MRQWGVPALIGASERARHFLNGMLQADRSTSGLITLPRLTKQTPEATVIMRAAEGRFNVLVARRANRTTSDRTGVDSLPSCGPKGS